MRFPQKAHSQKARFCAKPCNESKNIPFKFENIPLEFRNVPLNFGSISLDFDRIPNDGVAQKRAFCGKPFASVKLTVLILNDRYEKHPCARLRTGCSRSYKFSKK